MWYLPSGKIFIWNDLPNNTASKLPKAVRKNKNTRDPKYPPKTMCNLEDINQVLYICIPENRRIVRIDDRRKETLLVTAEIKYIHM